MDKYFLFRGNTLVGTNDPNLMGAGDLHDIGQEGDVLIAPDKKSLRAWNWCSGGVRTGHLPWQSVALTSEQESYYRTLILLMS